MPSLEMNARLLFEQGRQSFAAQDYDEAAASFKRAVAVDPQYNEAHQFLATCYQRLGYTTRARRAWEALLRITTDEKDKAEIAERLRSL